MGAPALPNVPKELLRFVSIKPADDVGPIEGDVEFVHSETQQPIAQGAYSEDSEP